MSRHSLSPNSNGGACNQADCGCTQPLPPSSLLGSTNHSVIVPTPDDLPSYNLPRDDYRVPTLEQHERTFRHSGWLAPRRRIFAAMQACSVSDFRLDRFANCGSMCMVQWSPSAKRFRLSANYCRDRLCIPCGLARSNIIRSNLVRHCAGRVVRMATFTTKHNHTSLKDQITRLYKAFADLRRREFFKQNITGGCIVLEVKVGKDGLWHPHLHTLLEGCWVAQGQLSKEWLAVTGDSWNVDIRPCGADGKEIGYVAAYTGKPMDASVHQSPRHLAEFIPALKGVRVCNCFGTWRRLKLSDPDPDAPDDWATIGSLARLIDDADAGDKAAEGILKDLLHRPADEKPRSP